MSEENYFQNALSNFIFESACGGAIRHLADLGLTSRQIADRLTYPVPYERVREAVTAYLLEKGILLDREPGQGDRKEKYVYVQEHGKYGKTSFRRVPVETAGVETGQAGTEVVWTGKTVTCRELAELLRQFQAQDGGAKAYVSCDFGRTGTEFAGYAVLNDRQQEYLRGICWDRRRMYHLLDERMTGIVMGLCESNLFSGRVYSIPERKFFVVERTEEF